MLAEARQVITPFAQVPGSADPLGGFLVSELGGKYAEMQRRGLIFTASNVAAQAVSVALNTAYTGLMVYNPVGNTKRMYLLGCMYALSVAPGAIASLSLISGSATISSAYTHTVQLAAPGIVSGIVGPSSPTSSMGADSSATVPTPVYRLQFGSGFTASALYATTPSWIDLGGLIAVDPGGFIAWGALTAVTGFGSFAWAEY